MIGEECDGPRWITQNHEGDRAAHTVTRTSLDDYRWKWDASNHLPS